MAGMVFEPHDASAVASGDVVFCVVILCLSALSMIIFAASAGGGDDGLGSGGAPAGRTGRCSSAAGLRLRRCRAGAGVCGTYLS